MEEEEDLLRAQLPKSLESNAKRSFTVTLPSLLSSFLLRLPSRVKSSFTSLIFNSPDCPSDHTGRELPWPQFVMNIMSAARLGALLLTY